MFDTHLHTEFSCDSHMTADQAVRAAAALGIGIIVTEHLDLDYPENPDEFVFDFNEYFQALEPLRQDGKLLLGVELGLRAECREQNRQLVKGWPFDQIIGSIHVVGGMDIYSPQYTKGQAKNLAYGRYISSMLECVEGFGDFDTLGHIDYICRYAQYEDPELYLADFFDQWTAICRVLVGKDKVLELNTRRLDQPRAVKALEPFYRRYRELGGRYVTIGSDAHWERNVGCRLAEAWALAEAWGLVPVYFKGRKRFKDQK